MAIRKSIKRFECRFSDLGKRNFTTHDRKHHDSFEPDLELEDATLVYDVSKSSETRDAVKCINAHKVSDPIDHLMNKDEGEPEEIENRRSIRGNIWASNVHQAIDRLVYSEDVENLKVKGENEKDVIQAESLKGVITVHNLLRREMDLKESFTIGVYQSLNSMKGRAHDQEVELGKDLELEVS